MAPQNLLEKLYCNMPPKARVGNWNNILAGELDEAGNDTTFARLAAVQAGKAGDVLYDTFNISKIWLPLSQYRVPCRLRKLQEISKEKSGVNSCAQFTGYFFPFAQSLSCSSIQSICASAIEASTECWINDGQEKREIFDFLDGDNSGFEKVYSQVALQALGKSCA